MDVARLQKVNELARTLRNQGFVANQEEASALATEIAGTKEQADVFSGMQVNANQEMVLNQESLAVAGDQMPKPAFNSHLYYTKQQVENVLQQFSNHVCTEVTALQEQVRSQNRMMSEMRMAMEHLKKGAVIQRAPEESPQATLNVENRAQEAMVENKPPVQENPRSGGFSSADVAIDKIFYFGNS